MIAKPVFLSLAVAGLILGVAGCSSDSGTATPKSTGSASSSPSSSASSSGSENSETAVITIKNFTFEGPESVAPGTEIMVKNEDDAAHTVTAEGDGGFDLKLDPGASGTFTAPSEAGDYPYICAVHPGMKGSLAVK